MAGVLLLSMMAGSSVCALSSSCFTAFVRTRRDAETERKTYLDALAYLNMKAELSNQQRPPRISIKPQSSSVTTSQFRPSNGGCLVASNVDVTWSNDGTKCTTFDKVPVGPFTVYDEKSQPQNVKINDAFYIRYNGNYVYASEQKGSGGAFQKSLQMKPGLPGDGAILVRKFSDGSLEYITPKLVRWPTADNRFCFAASERGVAAGILKSGDCNKWTSP